MVFFSPAVLRVRNGDDLDPTVDVENLDDKDICDDDDKDIDPLPPDDIDDPPPPRGLMSPPPPRAHDHPALFWGEEVPFPEPGHSRSLFK